MSARAPSSKGESSNVPRRKSSNREGRRSSYTNEDSSAENEEAAIRSVEWERSFQRLLHKGFDITTNRVTPVAGRSSPSPGPNSPSPSPSSPSPGPNSPSPGHSSPSSGPSSSSPGPSNPPEGGAYYYWREVTQPSRGITPSSCLLIWQQPHPCTRGAPLPWEL
ncbi:hypothetical protein AVEN_38635-1 [Araneus ventricosus]|uniref:Uncharacterized protein n=1 Tax=Araneus ventricosus TaxID=182803 RepID=A0A4Y2FKT9_ARAVE|nr:hypothetical protein AVEN_38635-1 [Araneus ventricosus]